MTDSIPVQKYMAPRWPCLIAFLYCATEEKAPAPAPLQACSCKIPGSLFSSFTKGVFDLHEKGHQNRPDTWRSWGRPHMHESCLTGIKSIFLLFRTSPVCLISLITHGWLWLRKQVIIRSLLSLLFSSFSGVHSSLLRAEELWRCGPWSRPYDASWMQPE